MCLLDPNARAALSIENLGATNSSREKPLEGELKARARPQPGTSLLRLLATAQDAGSRLDTLALAVPATVGAGFVLCRDWREAAGGLSSVTAWVHPLDQALRAVPGKCSTPTPDTRPSRGKAWGCRSDARCVAPDKSRPSAKACLPANDARASDIPAASSASLQGITWPGRDVARRPAASRRGAAGGRQAIDLPDGGNREERSLAGKVSGRW